MRQLNFDLKTLQARHREGAFVTRRDRAYVLDQAAHMLHALGYPPLQQGMNVSGVPLEQDCLGIDSAPSMGTVWYLDIPFPCEDDRGCKTSGARQRLRQVQGLSMCSVRVVGIFESHFDVVVQQLALASECPVTGPLIEDGLQIEGSFRQVYEISPLQVVNQSIDFRDRTMLCELANVPFVERPEHEHFQPVFGPGDISCLWVFTTPFGPLLGEGQVAFDQIAIGPCAPRVGTAGNAYMGAMLRVPYLPAKASDRLLEGSRILEPGFIDGIEVEPGIVLRAKPLLKSFSASDVKGVLEVVSYILDPAEERRAALLLDVLCPRQHLECLAGARFGQDHRAILLVEVLPRRGAAKLKKFLDLFLVGIAW